MIDLIKKNVFSRIDAECFLPGADIHSPKVQNLYYKPILTYIYYVLQFIGLKQQYEELRAPIHHSQSPYSQKDIRELPPLQVKKAQNLN